MIIAYLLSFISQEKHPVLLEEDLVGPWAPSELVKPNGNCECFISFIRLMVIMLMIKSRVTKCNSLCWDIIEYFRSTLHLSSC